MSPSCAGSGLVVTRLILHNPLKMHFEKNHMNHHTVYEVSHCNGPLYRGSPCVQSSTVKRCDFGKRKGVCNLPCDCWLRSNAYELSQPKDEQRCRRGRRSSSISPRFFVGLKPVPGVAGCDDATQLRAMSNKIIHLVWNGLYLHLEQWVRFTTLFFSSLSCWVNRFLIHCCVTNNFFS